jgi:hypothetical protein
MPVLAEKDGTFTHRRSINLAVTAAALAAACLRMRGSHVAGCVSFAFALPFTSYIWLGGSHQHRALARRAPQSDLHLQLQLQPRNSTWPVSAQAATQGHQLVVHI